jgi:hypothetical protein
VAGDDWFKLPRRSGSGRVTISAVSNAGLYHEVEGEGIADGAVQRGTDRVFQADADVLGNADKVLIHLCDVMYSSGTTIQGLCRFHGIAEG